MKTTLLFVLLIFPFVGFSQDQLRIDSLNKALSTTSEPMKKVPILNALGKEYMLTDPTQALKYLAIGSSILDTNNDTISTGRAENYYYSARAYFMNGDFAKAKEQSDRSLTVCKNSKNNTLLIKNYFALAEISTQNENYNEAMIYDLQALKNAEQLADKKSCAKAYMNLGNIYYQLGNPDKALESFRHALSYYSETGNSRSIGAIYSNIGTAFYGMKRYDSALFYFHRSEDICSQLNDQMGLASVYSNIGQTEVLRGETDFAISYFKKEMAIRTNVNDQYGRAACYLNLGNAFADKYRKNNSAGDFTNAETYLNMSVETATQLSARELLLSGYSSLADLYALKKDYKQAYELIVRHSELKDSLIQDENLRQLTQMELKYEYAKHESEIQRLQLQQQLYATKQELAKCKSGK